MALYASMPASQTGATRSDLPTKDTMRIPAVLTERTLLYSSWLTCSFNWTGSPPRHWNDAANLWIWYALSPTQNGELSTRKGFSL